MKNATAAVLVFTFKMFFGITIRLFSVNAGGARWSTEPRIGVYGNDNWIHLQRIRRVPLGIVFAINPGRPKN